MLISVMQDPEIDNVQYAKLLGITISSDLTWNTHVENIVAKAGKIVYMLYKLKRAGKGQHDLVAIYVSVIRRVIETCMSRMAY